MVGILFAANTINGIPSPKAQDENTPPPIDCDSFFSDVIQIEEKMMSELSDLDLAQAYNLRNSEMASCLNFFTKFLAKLDHYLSNIESLENISISNEENSSDGLERKARHIKQKYFWKRAKFNANKKFW